MTPARQRLGKYVPEVTLLTTERRLKAGIVKSEQTSSARQQPARARVPWNYTRFHLNEDSIKVSADTKKQAFSMETGNYISGRLDKHGSIRKTVANDSSHTEVSIRKKCSAEEVTDSWIRTKP
jgi:hypothetical protein